MKATTAEWLRSARDDLLVIGEIIDNQALTHMVAFHAQQSIEKSFKAVLEELEGSVPRIHVLETLLPKVQRYLKFSVDLDLLEDLDKLYLDARYPGSFGLLPLGKPDQEDAENFRAMAKTICSSIEEFLLEHRL
jgi:HEPN domain-containing protein